MSGSQKKKTTEELPSDNLFPVSQQPLVFFGARQMFVPKADALYT